MNAKHAFSGKDHKFEYPNLNSPTSFFFLTENFPIQEIVIHLWRSGHNVSAMGLPNSRLTSAHSCKVEHRGNQSVLAADDVDVWDWILAFTVITSLRRQEIEKTSEIHSR